MMKPSHLLVAAIASTALAGCQLYFGEDHENEQWTYCGSDGYYVCDDSDCYWQGTECPAGANTGSGGMTGGFECNTSNDCAAGCYCGNGTCEEAGFCTQDSDCGNGYTCNESRSSCEPDITASCTDDSNCPSGSYCDGGTCTASCGCMTDGDATGQGYGYCDEDRATCMPGDDPSGTCTGAVTCNLGRPSCPAGQVALIVDGCYSGECTAIASCGEAPGCNAYTNESDCQAATGCQLSYTGIDCRMPDNSPCQAGSTSCTCYGGYTFAACNSAP